MNNLFTTSSQQHKNPHKLIYGTKTLQHQELLQDSPSKRMDIQRLKHPLKLHLATGHDKSKENEPHGMGQAIPQGKTDSHKNDCPIDQQSQYQSILANFRLTRRKRGTSKGQLQRPLITISNVEIPYEKPVQRLGRPPTAKPKQSYPQQDEIRIETSMYDTGGASFQQSTRNSIGNVGRLWDPNNLTKAVFKNFSTPCSSSSLSRNSPVRALYNNSFDIDLMRQLADRKSLKNV
ncbi:hypothetical protein FGO68_gene14165 [Halteria grandinella]|uniref:Uncharacterized protein n=1 Tax=Halteria grandinella TaxID=5974 RepID=A0A8J8NJT8_HALGN|nr:hypothetical protein FGO68_gene14165 [Halteria grandinella]